MGVKKKIWKLVALIVLSSTLFVSPCSTLNLNKTHVLAAENLPQPPSRLGTYWLNFSLVDIHHSPYANFGLEFYVDGNQSGFWDGFANTPTIIEHPAIKFVEFTNMSHLFMTDTFNNGSIFQSRYNFAGPPDYGPPGYNYGPYGLCGFPCVSGNNYFALNGTGFQNVYESWGYWFVASSLLVIPSSNTERNQSVPDLNLIVNVSVSIFQNKAYFKANIQIRGASYSLLVHNDSSLCVIQTGIDFSPSQWNALSIGIVSVLLVVAASVAAFFVKRHRSRR